jgi:hypothetical protein
MLDIKITGLDEFQRELADAQHCLEALDGTITTLKFNPADPESVQTAIKTMESAVDSKIAPYRHNALVSQVAQDLKEQYRKGILERASAGTK